MFAKKRRVSSEQAIADILRFVDDDDLDDIEDIADIDNLEELNRPNAQEDEIDLEIVSGKKYIF